ncbi:MAG: hypothetical protein RL385_4395 [Pseudomonadota bacterium]|jgi:hypothetical protein
MNNARMSLQTAWALGLLALGLWPASPAVALDAAPPSLQVSVWGPTDRVAAQKLALLLGTPVDINDAPVPPSSPSCPGRVRLELDTGAGEVRRIDTCSGERRVRALPMEAGPPSPYQVAFVASELLPLGLRPHLAASAHAGEDAETVRLRPLFVASGRGGNALDGPPPLASGTLGLGLALGLPDPRSSLEWLLEGELGATPRQPLSTGDTLRLVRRAGRLRIGVHHQLRHVSVGAVLEAALFWTRAQLPAFSDMATRTSLQLACGVEVRWPIAPRLSLFIAGSAGVSAFRSVYRVAGDGVARERRYSETAALGLVIHFTP